MNIPQEIIIAVLESDKAKEAEKAKKVEQINPTENTDNAEETVEVEATKEAKKETEEVVENSEETPKPKETVKEEAEVTEEVEATPEKVEEAPVTLDVSSYKETIRKSVKRTREVKKALKSMAENANAKEELLTAGIKKTVDSLVSIRKELKEAKAKTKFYMKNAKEIVKRQIELGESADKLTDEDILNDDKYNLAKTEQENVLLKASIEKDDDIVGDKSKDEILTANAKKISDMANGKASRPDKLC